MNRLAELAAIALALTGIAAACVVLPAREEPASRLRTISTSTYNLLTDASATDARRILHSLDQLRHDFAQHFAPLISPQQNPGIMQVVFFSHEADYRRYVFNRAPQLAGSAGFFSFTDNRLALFDQLSSADYTRAQLGNDQLRQYTPDARDHASAALAGEARAATERLLRHEGAHQLFHAYRIESPLPVTPTWLTEGLAAYCEPATIGARHEAFAARVIQARNTGTLLSLDQLLHHRDPAGFFALEPDQVETAYAESWALTYFLMTSPHRADFLEYIHESATSRTQHDFDSKDIAQPWQDFIDHL